jgi:hypothetical protein
MFSPSRLWKGSRHEFETLRTACELYPQLGVRIHGDLKDRLQSAVTELTCCVIRRAGEVEWASFGRDLVSILHFMDVALEVGAATRLIQRMTSGGDTQSSWNREELELLSRAAYLVDRGPAAIPHLIAADFHLSWKAFEKFVGRKPAKPAVRSFAAALRERIANQAPNSAFVATLSLG